jgi:hypothetical protein
MLGGPDWRLRRTCSRCLAPQPVGTSIAPHCTVALGAPGKPDVACVLLLPARHSQGPIERSFKRGAVVAGHTGGQRRRPERTAEVVNFSG